MAKRVLITGASGGIGRGVSQRLGQDGWHVLAHGRNQARLDGTVEVVRNSGGTGSCFSADISDMTQLEGLANWAVEAGTLDAVVHCAANFSYGKVSTERFSDWDQTIDCVLRATIRLTAHCLPAVTAAQGAFVFICGPTSWLGWKNHAIHCAIRHAQAGFAKALFEDVREDGVGVTVIHPGFVASRASMGEGKDPSRMIQLEDIAEVIANSLALPKTSCIMELTLRPQRSPYV